MASPLATIKAIRGGVSEGGKSRLVLELDRAASFHAQTATTPDRIILDLNATPLTADTPQNLPAGMNITRMEQVQAKDHLTLSFILKGPATIKSAFSLPRAGDKPDRIAIDYVFSTAPKKENLKKTPLPPTPLTPKTAGDPPKILGTLTYTKTLPPTTALPPPATPKPSEKPTKFLKDLDLSPHAPTPLIPIPKGKPEKSPSKPSTESPPAKPSAYETIKESPPADTGDTESSTAGAPHIHTIAVDAGHGGKDPGAIGVGGLHEKDITIAAARELKRQLEQTGRFRVVMTRSDDSFILLPERVRIARRAKADLFVSLHADMAAEAQYTNGLSIYTLSDTASDAQTEKLAAQENKVDLLAGMDLSHEQEDVANILIDLAMRENMNQSRFFAGKVVKSMSEGGIELLEKPHRYAGFAVLKAPDIPSVLVEMGFVSNPAEARRLQDGAHRRRLMENLTRGISQYFDYIDKKSQF